MGIDRRREVYAIAQQYSGADTILLPPPLLLALALALALPLALPLPLRLPFLFLLLILLLLLLVGSVLLFFSCSCSSFSLFFIFLHRIFSSTSFCLTLPRAHPAILGGGGVPLGDCSHCDPRDSVTDDRHN